ncbi:molybdenum cofactor guanylyltransferase [Halomicroarcula sp. S1AR25-4]|uniref:molybdenum cofactor guanylyltransferase n=1 Tax=Haloarcula sp. S1AR25-4 TaxID=2950538 RepID=UPI00287444F6|nr:molybdenum cofactor guanylyltransferase [Halomicroarcula sp. S1AR25-4]MDS0278895.1 molybdenum cofactor guanylyltransferase [Halomicroarcula sp. S1AR25-4]
MRSGVVLAGGYSTRFGPKDKATAELDGTPLVRRVVDRIEPAVDEVVVNCRRGQRTAIDDALTGHDYRLAVDPVPDGGPVAGVRAGCRVARGRETFVTACDMPFVRPLLAERLFEASEGDGAVPRIGGRLRPLAAVYHTRAVIEAADTTLGLGSGALRDMLDRLSMTVVPGPAPARAVSDVDTRAGLRAAESRST